MPHDPGDAAVRGGRGRVVRRAPGAGDRRLVEPPERGEVLDEVPVLIARRAAEPRDRAERRRPPSARAAAARRRAAARGTPRGAPRSPRRRRRGRARARTRTRARPKPSAPSRIVARRRDESGMADGIPMDALRERLRDPLALDRACCSSSRRSRPPCIAWVRRGRGALAAAVVPRAVGRAADRPRHRLPLARARPAAGGRRRGRRPARVRRRRRPGRRARRRWRSCCSRRWRSARCGPMRAESTTAAATALVVLLTGYSDDGCMLLARLADTFVGIAVGLAVNLAVWPPLRDRVAARRIDRPRRPARRAARRHGRRPARAPRRPRPGALGRAHARARPRHRRRLGRRPAARARAGG